MEQEITSVIISQAGAVGAMLVGAIVAIVAMWRHSVKASDKFAETLGQQNERLITHLDAVHQTDMSSRVALQTTIATLVERVTQLATDLREHDRHMTILAMGARPAGGSEPGEDLSNEPEAT